MKKRHCALLIYPEVFLHKWYPKFGKEPISESQYVRIGGEYRHYWYDFDMDDEFEALLNSCVPEEVLFVEAEIDDETTREVNFAEVRGTYHPEKISHNDTFRSSMDSIALEFVRLLDSGEVNL